MSGRSSPYISPELNENVKEVSLFDPDTKDSGFSEDISEEAVSLVSSPLSFEDNEATILCFSSQDILDITPNKKAYMNNKKRLFLSPKRSPSIIAASSLKRLKLLDFECDEISDISEEFPLDFSHKILAECSDDEVPSVPSFEVQQDLMKEAVEKSEAEHLIGDFTKGYALPLIAGYHSDLKSISVDTLRDVLEGKFDHILNSVQIIDSRYPYEFQGGHIRGAKNIYTKEDCLKLLNNTRSSKNERHVLIFHCEFSRVRGPSMIRNLRKEDRTRNTLNYPALTYPEIYVLEGGYKKFFEAFPQLCEPMEYKQMFHPDHADELRFFRKRSKTSDAVSKTSKRNESTARSSKVVRKFLSNDF